MSVQDLPIAKFYGNEGENGFSGFISYHYILPIANFIWPEGLYMRMFGIFAQIVPTVLSIAGIALLGAFLAEGWWKQAIGNIVPPEALQAINISSIILASIAAGIIVSIAFPNIIAAIMNEYNKTETPHIK